MEVLVRPFVGDQEKGQCQLATDIVTAKDTILGQSIQNVIIVISVIALYTAIVFLIGYRFGFQNGQRKVLVEKVTSGKMTMTPVTYTFARGVKEPRFECHPHIGGCWP